MDLHICAENNKAGEVMRLSSLHVTQVSYAGLEQSYLGIYAPTAVMSWSMGKNSLGEQTTIRLER
jgi:hypothetical protein